MCSLSFIKILVIDGNSAVLSEICRNLSTLGYTTHHANNGRPALELISEVHPQIILCAKYLPDMEGTQLFHLIKSNPEINAPYCVLMTSCSETFGKAEHSDLEADALMPLPLDPMKMQAFVEVFINHTKTIEKLKGQNELLLKVSAERKKLEDTIDHYNKRYSIAQSFGNIGLWEYNYKTKVFWASDETLKICNIEGDRSKINVKNFIARMANRKLTLKSFIGLVKQYHDFNYIFEIDNPEYNDLKYIITKVEIEKDEYDNPLKIIGVVMDITERQMAYKAAMESESKLKEIFNSTQEAILIYDVLSMKMVDLNDRAVEMYGYHSKEEMLSLTILELFAGKAPYSAERLQSLLKKAKKKGPLTIDWLAKRHDGSFFWAEVSLKMALLHKEDRFISVIRDVTERKNMDIQIVALKEDLEMKVERRTKELSEQVEKLDKSQKAMLFMVEDLNKMTAALRIEKENLKIANHELESFSYSISHDLRAPLRAINGFSEILMENHAENLGDEGRRLCKIIHDNTLKMGKLIDDLLAFSRLNRTEIKKTKINMASLADEVYLELTNPEQRRNINWHVGQIKHTEGDLALMRQVWINLISNAIKFSSIKQVPKIEITCRQSEERCEYCIRDNGVGFDMRYADKLFGVFQRLHAGHEFEGTGVGLAIVHNIITRHGGRIRAEGRVDEGAAFYFSLPLYHN